MKDINVLHVVSMQFILKHITQNINEKCCQMTYVLFLDL